MIQCLIIGSDNELDRYSEAIHGSKFFSRVDKSTVNGSEEYLFNINTLSGYDAIFILCRLKNALSFFSELIKYHFNFYFVDQPLLTSSELEVLEQLYSESGNLIFPDFREMNLPVVQEFISSDTGYLQFRYEKSISGKKDIRQALLTGLEFLTMLSPMPVKKIDVHSLETTTTGRPTLKVRLKMWDSSVCYIILKIDNKKEHSILLESKNGNFNFNLAEGYLENIHGTRFQSDIITPTELFRKSVDAFALDIILNRKPIFSFRHYLLSVNILSKINNILRNSF